MDIFYEYEKFVKGSNIFEMTVTLGPKEDILRTHSTVNMAVKIRFRSASTSENSRGAPWN